MEVRFLGKLQEKLKTVILEKQILKQPKCFRLFFAGARELTCLWNCKWETRNNGRSYRERLQLTVGTNFLPIGVHQY